MVAAAEIPPLSSHLLASVPPIAHPPLQGRGTMGHEGRSPPMPAPTTVDTTVLRSTRGHGDHTQTLMCVFVCLFVYDIVLTRRSLGICQECENYVHILYHKTACSHELSTKNSIHYHSCLVLSSPILLSLCRWSGGLRWPSGKSVGLSSRR